MPRIKSSVVCGRDSPLQLQSENGGIVVGLTDHFSPPFDPEDMLEAVYMTQLGVGRFGLRESQWHDVVFAWDRERNACDLTVDSQPAVALPLLRRSTA